MDNKEKSLQLTHILLKNFRCFKQLTLDLDESMLLIQGPNGSGKTSLLEALYYACYLRSFRTHAPKNLIMFDKSTFFIKTTFREKVVALSTSNEIQVGLADGKRLVKINRKPISSYKELMENYRIISVTEDDLALIKGGPQLRRMFIDQAIVLVDSEFISILRSFRRVLENRNKLLQQRMINQDNYSVWTQNLWELSHTIQYRRQEILKIFSQEINKLLAKYFDVSWSIVLDYKAKNMSKYFLFDDFIRSNSVLFDEEKRIGRALFGAHLDDIIINMEGRKSKIFASRGQQKLIVLLIKIVQIKYLAIHKGPSIFLLDDFMADFDPKRAQILIHILLELKNQLIFTSPIQRGCIEKYLYDQGARSIFLTH